jgi:hypothetical protein
MCRASEVFGRVCVSVRACSCVCPSVCVRVLPECTSMGSQGPQTAVCACVHACQLLILRCVRPCEMGVCVLVCVCGGGGLCGLCGLCVSIAVCDAVWMSTILRGT